MDAAQRRHEVAEQTLAEKRRELGATIRADTETWAPLVDDELEAKIAEVEQHTTAANAASWDARRLRGLLTALEEGRGATSALSR